MISSNGSTTYTRVLLLLLALLASASPAARASAQSAASEGLTTLSPGDVVRVEIWQEKDLTGDFLVQPNGTATFPLIGEQKVAGSAPEQLRQNLQRLYQQYLRNPSINITTLRRIQVLGEVNRPGVYLIDPTVTLSGAVAMASGANGNGDPRQIRIVRQGRVYQAAVGPATTLVDADIRSGDQIVIGQKNWFVRNSTFVISLLIGLPTTVLTIVNAL